jgi:hypothetical protein
VNPELSIMKKLSFWAGVLCLLYAGLGLIADFLPLDVWSYILDLFMDREPNTYYKVVPSDGSSYHILMASIVGVALIVIGKLDTSEDRKES